MQEYIGISEDRLHHILGVARKAYKIAKGLGYDEDFCRKMFMIGWVHDVGYEFSKSQTDHPDVSFDLVCRLVCPDHSCDIPISPTTNHAISRHGMYPSEGFAHNPEWRIINMADMQVDSKGNEVDAIDRLRDIRDRYGDWSDQYLTACDICYRVGLTAVNMAAV